MKKASRILSLMLALILLVSCFAACGETEEDPADTGEQATEAATDPAQLALDEVAPVDWGGGSFGILYTDDIAGYAAEVYAESYAIGDKSSAQVINDAVFERNTMFEDRCHLDLDLVGEGVGKVVSDLRTQNTSGSADFQFFTLTTNEAANLATSGQLYNYLNLDIDYEQPWFDQGTLEFALAGKVFFMNGSHNTVDDDVTFVTLFNKKLADEYQTDNLYAKVRDNEWTIDYFTSLIQGISAENGDGKWDEHDTYGFTAPGSIGNTFFYGCGLQYVINNREMDQPELALNEGLVTKANDVLDKVRQITLANNSSWIAPAGKESVAMDIFKTNRALFYVEASSYIGNLNKTMDGDYGVLPIPKYDKNQTEYLTWTHPISSTLVFPITFQETDKLSSIVETWVILSHMKLRPAYYDTMLTKRNIRDAESSEMLDIIFAHRVYDMAMYFSQLNMGSLFSDAALASSSNFASSYAKVSKTFPKQIKMIMKAFEKMDK